uniref:Terminase small subunit n=1 Tax=Burkholderia phage vB_BgluM-SURPRISE13 TaxID=3159457 RepID=A0AAU7PFI0_9VIRU
MSGLTPEQIEANFQDLDYTTGIRKQIVAALLPDALGSKDPELARTVMQGLDGIDKVSLGRLKLNEKARENETRADEAAAMAQYLVTLADRRQKEGRPEVTHNETANRKLPADSRPAYDPSIRDAAAGSENTAEFTERVEGSNGKR